MNINFQTDKQAKVRMTIDPAEIEDLRMILATMETPGWTILKEKYCAKGGRNLTEQIKFKARNGDEKGAAILANILEGFEQWIVVTDSMKKKLEEYFDKSQVKEAKDAVNYGDGREDE